MTYIQVLTTLFKIYMTEWQLSNYQQDTPPLNKPNTSNSRGGYIKALAQNEDIYVHPGSATESCVRDLNPTNKNSSNSREPGVPHRSRPDKY